MSNPTQALDRHVHGSELHDELARIASDVQALAIRHGITHAAHIDTPNLIRALQTIQRRATEDAAILRALHDPISTCPADRHRREVEAVRASLLRADTSAERHGVYPLRHARTA